MPVSPHVRAMKRMALQVNDHFKGKRVHFIGMDWSGIRELNRFLEALHHYTQGPAFEYSAGKALMTLDMDERFGECRRVVKLEGSAWYDHDIDAYFAFENNTESGISAVSGPISIAYGIYEDTLPARSDTKIYLGMREDSRAVGNFAAKLLYEYYMGLRRFAYHKMPRTHADLKSKNLLNRFSSYNPQRDRDVQLVLPIRGARDDDEDSRLHRMAYLKPYGTLKTPRHATFPVRDTTDVIRVMIARG